MRLILTFGLIAALALPAAAQSADPYAAVAAMRAAFAQVHSAVATERFSTGDGATVEFVSPNRYHITMPHEQIVLAGDTEYAKRPGGSWIQGAHGAEHQAMQQAAWQLAGSTNADLHKLYKISAIGTKTVAGATVRGYHLHDLTGGLDEDVWVGANDLPVAARIAMPGQTIEIRYANYNSGTLIATPM